MTDLCAINRCKVVLPKIILLAILISTSATSINQVRGPRSLQVTGALDWPRQVDNSSELEHESHGQPTQPDSSELIATSKPDDAVLDTALEVPQESLNSAQEEKSLLKGSSFFLVILTVALVSFAASLAAFVVRRRHDILRWREYQTHRLLQAQDEAFKLSHDEALDLELVEGSAAGLMQVWRRS
jgi:hypothetical protein